MLKLKNGLCNDETYTIPVHAGEACECVGVHMEALSISKVMLVKFVLFHPSFNVLYVQLHVFHCTVHKYLTEWYYNICSTSGSESEYHICTTKKLYNTKQKHL